MPSTAPLRPLLADTAARLGPDAPTLCDPWDVRQLLAHLVVRESRPDALPGIGVDLAPLTAHTERVQSRVAAQDFGQLVEQVRSGPAPWWPTRIATLDRLVNTAELAIHHEDMVRAQPGWTPTELSSEVQTQLWSTLRGAGRLLYRTAPVGVVAVADGHGRAALRRPTGEAGTVVLRGTPLELVLHAFGRERVAQVQAEGAPADLQALAAHRRGV